MAFTGAPLASGLGFAQALSMLRSHVRWLAPVTLFSVISACKPDYSEAVATDVCASGRRWAGEVTGHEEMFPGWDCVGCHKLFDGPEFMAAGTIYGVIDEDGARTTQHDCYGVEGVHVTITAADGQVLEAVTNRAGNFFFEGPESALAKPFSVLVEYTAVDGHSSREPMGTYPSYGGCARCHSHEAESTPGAMPGATLGPDEVVRVYPIFTGPVSE